MLYSTFVLVNSIQEICAITYEQLANQASCIELLNCNEKKKAKVLGTGSFMSSQVPFCCIAPHCFIINSFFVSPFFSLSVSICLSVCVSLSLPLPPSFPPCLSLSLPCPFSCLGPLTNKKLYFGLSKTLGRQGRTKSWQLEANSFSSYFSIPSCWTPFFLKSAVLLLSFYLLLFFHTECIFKYKATSSFAFPLFCLWIDCYISICHCQGKENATLNCW